MSMFPLVTFDGIGLHQANQLLVAWGHKMGPLAFSHSGTDARSGRVGRNKWIWVWQPGHGA